MDSNNTIKVSIIIPHHNNFEILNDCIQSIMNISYNNYEIIIIDNNSTDQSIKKIKNTYDNLIIHRSNINLGYAKACNLGSELSKGNYLLFLNNDTIHESSFINYLVDKIESDNNIACVQPKIKNFFQKDYFDYAGAAGGYMDYLVFPFARGRIFSSIEQDKGQYDTSKKVFWTSGAAFLTKKSIFTSIGGFDSRFFAHMEEIDYCWKCNLMGYDCWIEPKSVVFHHGGKTLEYNSTKKVYLNHRNSLVMLLTNYKFSLALYLFPIRLIFEIISSLYELSRFRIKSFFVHYIALISVILNIKYLIKRKKDIDKIRIKSDRDIFDKKIILKHSIVLKYFLFRNKEFNSIMK